MPDSPPPPNPARPQPTRTPALRAKAKAIFVEAVELPVAERHAFIEQACRGDAETRAEVRSLLAAIEEAGDAFDAPPPPSTAETRAFATMHDELVGTSVGPYRILELIGEGGFGSVYMAQQTEPVVRRVALKIIKLGMDTKQVIARFEAERQALAMMDHPNIARVLDAGATSAGRPYFVMELVKGVPITEYCDTANLRTRDRLDLFLAVCHAIQHAHQKGIIHRDIKPSNVLVTVADGRPLPKVIDFGIAKATGGRLTDKTLFTEFRQLLGTPEYMSPEQAHTHGVDVDTRTDIYSLGVLLYELLTGSTPFDAKRLRSAGFDELKRIIKEEEPQKPSTRVSKQRSPHSKTSADASRLRNAESGGLARVLRGELDWITMRAMDKDRSRRYETANALATDIERYLRNEPVLAGPPGAAYRLRKWARRNRAAVSAGATILIALVLGLGLATYGLISAMKERDDKEEARRAEAFEHARADEKAAEAFRQSYRASLAAAAAALELGDGAAMRRQLSAAPVELRGWEWKLLDSLADRSVRTLQVAGGGFNVSGVFGEYFVSESPYITRVMRWTDSFTADFDAGTLEGLESIAIAPGGRHFITSRYRGTMLYNLQTGRIIARWEDDRRFQATPFTPDGRFFASARSSEPFIDILDSETASIVRSFPKPPRNGRSFVTISPDGKLFAVESGDLESGVFDLATGQLRWTTRGIFPRFTPDGRKLLTFEGVASGASSLCVIDVLTGTRIASTQVHGLTLDVSGARANLVAVSPDSSTLAVQSDAGEIRILDLETLETLGTLVGLTQLGKGVGFSPDGRTLAAASSSGTLKIWAAATRASPYRVRHEGPIPPGTTSIDRAGRRIIQADWGRLILRDARTGEPEWTFFPSFEAWTATDFAPDGVTIAVAGERGTVLRIDTRTGRVLASATPLGFRAFGAAATGAVAWSADATKLAVVFREGIIVVLAADDLRILAQVPFQGDPRAMCWTDSDTLALASGDSVSLLSTTNPSAPKRQTPVAGARAMDLAEGGLAIGAADEIVLLSAADLSVIRRFPIPAPAESIAFRPDLKRVVTGHPDGTLTIRDTTSGDNVATFLASAAVPVRCLRFVGDDLIASTIRHALTRFEAGPIDTDLLARREELRQALGVIERLRPTAVHMSELATRIERDPTIPPRIREHAARVARTIGDHATLINNSSVIALNRFPALSDETLAAIDRDTQLATSRTNDPFALNVRGQALVRLGRFDEALDFLDRANQGFAATRPKWNPLTPSIHLFRVLALAGAGRRDEAREALATFERANADKPDPAIGPLLQECRAAVTREQ